MMSKVWNQPSDMAWRGLIQPRDAVPLERGIGMNRSGVWGLNGSTNDQTCCPPSFPHSTLQSFHPLWMMCSLCNWIGRVIHSLDYPPPVFCLLACHLISPAGGGGPLHSPGRGLFWSLASQCHSTGLLLDVTPDDSLASCTSESVS